MFDSHVLAPSPGRPRSPFRVERHRLGPRLFVLGRRIHEWHGGAALLIAAVTVLGLGGSPTLVLAALVTGGWLVVKDWHDLRPATRDTTAWRVGVHRAEPIAILNAPGERDRAARLVRRLPGGTLSAFSLRTDVRRLWTPAGDALAATRTAAGALLLAGDPVGAREAVRELIGVARASARSRGRSLGVLGCDESMAADADELGLRRLYLGDEAVVDCGPVDLRGNARKSLRKAVNRVVRNGYRAVLVRTADLTPGEAAELEALSTRWRQGATERGFSMAHDRLVDPLLPDAAVVVARDAAGRARGFLHFVPVFGRPAMSLGFMRRDRDTPNGLTDFLVVESARLLGEAGIGELSLNFVAFGRWLRAPSGMRERLAACVLRSCDRWFQIVRLLRFTAKFQPRWEPRYLLFGSRVALPRVALGALLAEGLIERPALRLRHRDRSGPQLQLSSSA